MCTTYCTLLYVPLVLPLITLQKCSPDSLMEPDDCVLTDVNLSDAIEDNLKVSRTNFSKSLASDEDSYIHQLMVSNISSLQMRSKN